MRQNQWGEYGMWNPIALVRTVVCPLYVDSVAYKIQCKEVQYFNLLHYWRAFIEIYCSLDVITAMRVGEYI